MCRGSGVDRRSHYPRLHVGVAVVWIDPKHAVHAHCGHENRFPCHGATGEARACAARHDRHVRVGQDAHDLAQFPRGTWKHDGQRGASKIGEGVTFVREESIGFGDHTFTPDDGPKLPCEGSFQPRWTASRPR